MLIRDGVRSLKTTHICDRSENESHVAYVEHEIIKGKYLVPDELDWGSG